MLKTRQLIWALFCYAFSYLPVLTLPVAIGMEYFGEYSIVKFKFDLFAAMFILGISQSYFSALRVLPLIVIESIYFFGAASIIVSVLIISIVGVTSINHGIILGSAIFAFAQVWRLHFLRSDLINLYQFINAFFPIAIAVQAVMISPLEVSYSPALAIFSSSILTAGFVYAMRRKFGAAVKLTRHLSATDFFYLIRLSVPAAFIQVSQFLLPVGVTLFFQKLDYSLFSIGEFGVAWSIYALILAPAIIFGGNLVASLERSGGVIPQIFGKKVTFKVFVALIASFILAMMNFGPIELSLGGFGALLPALIVMTLLALLRCQVPILIWHGQVALLSFVEFFRLFFALIYVLSIKPNNFIEHFYFLIVLELATCALLVVSAVFREQKK